jgi:hypothetical protein
VKAAAFWPGSTSSAREDNFRVGGVVDVSYDGAQRDNLNASSVSSVLSQNTTNDVRVRAANGSAS